MSQEESELKEFLFVTSKLKQNALIAKFLSLGLVAVSGLMVASSLGYMIYEVGNQKANLEECKSSKTALIDAVLNSNISESQKNQILELKDNEQFPSNHNTNSGAIGNTSIQNENRAISPSQSPRASDSPKPSVTPTDIPLSPTPTATVSPTPLKPEPTTPIPVNPNKKPGTNGTNNRCAEIRTQISAAEERRDKNQIIKLREDLDKYRCNEKKP